MSANLIAIDPNALTALINEARGLREDLARATVSPKKDWITIAEYASDIGRSTKTINRWISEGKIESKRAGTVKLVRAA